jgi:hypothetical protein
MNQYPRNLAKIGDCDDRAAFLTDHEDVDIAVLRRMRCKDYGDSPMVREMDDSDWQGLIDLIDAAPRMLETLTEICEYEDDPPDAGTRGHEIYSKAFELVEKLTRKNKTFVVSVCRISYSHNRDFEVEAHTEEEANEKALDMAGDHLYSEIEADYKVENITEKEAK